MSTIIKKGPITKTTQFSNLDVSKILESKKVGKDILDRNHLDNAAAKAAGLVPGDIYHTAGLVKIVF